MSDSLGAFRERERRHLRVDHGVDAHDLHLAFADLAPGRAATSRRRRHPGMSAMRCTNALVGANVRSAEDQPVRDEDEVRAERLVDVVEEAGVQRGDHAENRDHDRERDQDRRSGRRGASRLPRHVGAREVGGRRRERADQQRRAPCASGLMSDRRHEHEPDERGDGTESDQRDLPGEQHRDASDQHHPADEDPLAALPLLDLGDLRTERLQRRDACRLARRNHRAERRSPRFPARSPRPTCPASSSGSGPR